MDGYFQLTVAEKMDPETAWGLVGARIRVKGALGILLNRNNRIHGPLLLSQIMNFGN